MKELPSTYMASWNSQLLNTTQSLMNYIFAAIVILLALGWYRYTSKYVLLLFNANHYFIIFGQVLYALVTILVAFAVIFALFQNKFSTNTTSLLPSPVETSASNGVAEPLPQIDDSATSPIPTSQDAPTATTTPMSIQSDAQATSKAEIRATEQALATQEANNKSLQNAQATQSAQLKETADALATQEAGTQATKSALATDEAQKKALANAQSTGEAIAKATVGAQATNDALQRERNSAQATVEARVQATAYAIATVDAKARAAEASIATATAIARATRNARQSVSTQCNSNLNPYRFDQYQLQLIGCSSQEFVTSRLIVTQQFDHGFMIVFDDPSNNDFQKPGQQRRIYVAADDGRAWRFYFDSDDVSQNTSSNSNDWYSCDAKPGQRPKDSGIPWRNFGRVWCFYPEIRDALGYVRRGSDEVKGRASFQSYSLGRAFQIANSDIAYLIYLDADDNTIDNKSLTGWWETVRTQAVVQPVSTPKPQPATQPSTGKVFFHANQSIVCNDNRGQVWFEGYITLNGQPVNGYKVVFKSSKVPGTQPITKPAISGPHDGYTNWGNGYYGHIVDASSAQAKDKSLEIWIIDNAGNRISDYAYWHTEGSGGTCNKAIINFFYP